MDARSAPTSPSASRRLPAGTAARLEWLGVLVLLVAALLPRARDLFSGFDRHFEGFQGSCFAIFAINYERLGVDAFHGYPVINVDLPRPEDPSTWWTYPNHPPTTSVLGWLALRAMGPEGWQDAWREARAPEGVEGPLRLPFLLASLACLLGLYWAVRSAAGVQQGLLALGFYAVLPIDAAYGTLVNYEHPSLVGVLFAYGFYARWVRGGSSRNLLGVGLGFAAATAVTYGPAFFVPPLALHAWSRVGFRRAFRFGVAAAVGALLPLLAHAWLVGRAYDSIGAVRESLPQRVGFLMRPMFDGTMPITEWAWLQFTRMGYFFSWPLFLVAGVGLFAILKRALARRPAAEDDPLPIGALLFAGALLLLLGFYRHTFDDQDPFLLNAAPAAAALCAAAVASLAPRLWRLRAGIAPLVVVASMIAMPAVVQGNALRRLWRAPGPADGADASAPYVGPATPLPETAGRELAELLPPGSAGLYPKELGFNQAVMYYAWRTLMPVTDATGDSDTYELAHHRLKLAGMEDAPHYLLLPVDPPASLRAKLESVRAEFRAVSEPEFESESWEAYRLNPE